MKKYFAYDALEREFTTHDTLQEAKSQAQDCVDEIFDIGAGDGFGDDIEDGIKETCFGVALGGFDLPTRPLTKEEEDIYGDQYTYMVENPVLVEYPQNNGWIKCDDRLPRDNNDVLVVVMDNGNREIRIGFLANSCWYSHPDDDKLAKVTHWMHLPDLPKD
jgi:hypothetical protein